MIHIRNPHSVLAALETRPKDVTEIIVPSSALSGRSSLGEGWDRVLQLAKSRGVRLTGQDRTVSGGKAQQGKHPQGRPDSRGGQGRGPGAAGPASSGDEGGRIGVAEAIVKEREPVSAEELFADAPERAEGKGLWLALDCLQDPHNVGAIFRSAAFFGVQGILLTQERSAPLSGTVYDVASGGLEHVPFTLQTNLQRGFEVAKEAGLWILGTSEHAREDFQTVQRDRPWLLVIGNEEKGMRRLTEEACDVLCRVSPRGKVTSLNASVAAAIFISKLSGAQG